MNNLIPCILFRFGFFLTANLIDIRLVYNFVYNLVNFLLKLGKCVAKRCHFRNSLGLFVWLLLIVHFSTPIRELLTLLTLIVIIVKYRRLLLVILQLILTIMTVIIVIVMRLTNEVSKRFRLLLRYLISAWWLPRRILLVHIN